MAAQSEVLMKERGLKELANEGKIPEGVLREFQAAMLLARQSRPMSVREALEKIDAKRER